MSRALAPADLEVLQAARVLATRHQPYLAVALHSLVLRAAPGLGTFAVDRAWRMYADPAVLGQWSVEQVAAVLVHEVWHLLRDHAARGERVGITGRERAWNTACDAEINDDLLEAGLPLPGTPPTPARLRRPDGLLAEQYYAELPESSRWTVDCGSGADGRTREWEDGDAPGLTPVQADLVRAATAREVADAARQGTLPGGWERWAESLLRPKVDWRQVLAATVRGGLGWVAGTVDHTRSRPSRRGAAVPGVVLSSLRRPVPTVAVVVDTSGSVDDAMLGQALAEVDGALQAGGVRRESVTVLACDTQAGPAQRVRSAAQVRLAGGGGTDLRVGIDAAARLRPRPQLLVVLTDGRTPWPDAPPRGVRVVVALLSEPGTDGPPPPAWATVVRAHA
ncbi:MAG: putative metal-dependent peptidase [Frankiales bacterium]|nr:putative metal-dependent peptidase [Frankiales bacterium]